MRLLAPQGSFRKGCLTRTLGMLALAAATGLGSATSWADDAKVAEPGSSAEVDARIAAVENGLVPRPRIEGQLERHSLVERMHELNVPGVSIAVINDGRVEWARGYGVADAEAQTPVTPQTLFQAASISKPVACVATLRLVEQGKLDLNRNVNEFLKSWKLPENGFTAKQPVTLRGIMSHTAGLTIHGFPGYAVGEQRPTLPQILDGEEPANTNPVRVDKLPGEGFRYAGGGTTLMQLLLCDVTGDDFAEHMHKNVLVPLGMDESTYEQPLPDDRISQACAGHTRGGKVIGGKRHTYPEQAAAGLWTTPSQLAKYCLAVQEINAGATGRVLTPETVRAMLTQQNGGPAGLGPFLEEKGGHKTFSHSGGNAGFSCLMYAYADQGKGAIVMTNSDSPGRLISEIFDAIAEAYDWPGYLEPPAKALVVDDALAAKYSGKYSLGPLGLVTVERRGDKLVAILSLQGEANLYLTSPTRFFTDREGFTGKFELDQEGKAIEMMLPMLGRVVHAKRLP